MRARGRATYCGINLQSKGTRETACRTKTQPWFRIGEQHHGCDHQVRLLIASQHATGKKLTSKHLRSSGIERLHPASGPA